MSIRLYQKAEPATPPAGRYWLYVDEIDGFLKGKDDAGNITIFSSSILKYELITLSVTNITDKQLTLLETPYPGSVIQLIPVGGPTQVLSLDYDITEAVITWDGLGLDGILSEGDKIQIFYQTGV
jgi:hypothetical protein